MLPLEWKHRQHSKVTKTSARKHRNWEVVCGHHLQNHSFIGGVLLIAYNFHLLSIPFAQQHVKCIVNQCCFLSGQFDFTEVWLTWSYIVLFKCSLYFFEQCIWLWYQIVFELWIYLLWILIAPFPHRLVLVSDRLKQGDTETVIQMTPWWITVLLCAPACSICMQNLSCFSPLTCSWTGSVSLVGSSNLLRESC